MYQLRYYQKDCVEALVRSFRENPTNAPLGVISCGGGKTVIIKYLLEGAVANGKRVGLLADRKELLQQAEEKFDIPVGIYSASLGRRDTNNQLQIMQIQSVWQRAFEFGKFDLLLIDEAHCIPENVESRYRTFLKDCHTVNSQLRIAGLTATPYRLTSGLIYGPGQLFTNVAYEIGVKELIDNQYLCPLISRGGEASFDTTGLKASRGDYRLKDLEKLGDDTELVKKACDEIKKLAYDRKKILVFACSIRHAEAVAKCLGDAKVVTGDTPNRDGLLEEFERGEFRYLVNVNVLTTGYDCPSIDCVVLLRPTQSPGLYSQCVGRGLRKHPSKKDCLILDFGGNVERHGPLNAITPPSPTRRGEARKKDEEEKVRTCKKCRYINEITDTECRDCGAPLIVDRPLATHEATASGASILTDEDIEKIMHLDVEDVLYSKHVAKSGTDCLKVLYICKDVLSTAIQEFVNLEAFGVGRKLAIKWWQERTRIRVPFTVDEALEAVSQLAKPTAIVVDTSPKYPVIKEYVGLQATTNQEEEEYVS